MKKKPVSIGIIGAGAWGTAIGTALVRNSIPKEVVIWTYEKETAEEINTQHTNPFLHGIKLPPKLKATNVLKKIPENSEYVFLVCPSEHIRNICNEIKPHISKNTPLIIGSKGIEKGTLKFMSEVAQEILENPVAVISGPSFAEEVGNNIPTCVSLACADIPLAKKIQAFLQSETFTVRINEDVIGTEVCGALKNIIAIASGIYTGQERGQNEQANLMYEGLYEIKTLCVAKGGNASTVNEPCGVGDLILTCSSNKSRNTSLGIELGKGKSLSSILKQRKTCSEGVYTCQSIVALSKKLKISLPLCKNVKETILHNKLFP